MTTCGRCLFNGAFFTTECSRCVRTRQKLLSHFEREYLDASQEVVRLTELFKDVCWYNFEANCRNWNPPWYRSDPESEVRLHSQLYDHHYNRGKLRESARFPHYYAGRVADAPELPPRIVLKELDEAKAHLRACEAELTAPLDWAPGGAKYEALRRTTQVGRFSSVASDGGGPGVG